jgi:ComF family protein
MLASVGSLGLGSAIGQLIDLAMPPTCAGCGREGSALCVACGASLHVRSGLPGGSLLGLPVQLPAPLLQLEWCAPFHGPVRKALHQLKYSGERRLVPPLGAALARRWSEVGIGADLVVPVPVHRARARERGYDQAVLLATDAAGRLGLPVAAALQRQRATVAQYHLDRAHRAQNVAGAFVVGSGPGAPHISVAGRWVLLIDDVVTTGATLAACGQTLREAGAMAVSALTVARER